MRDFAPHSIAAYPAMHDICRQFSLYMAEHGLVTDDPIIADGRIHRCYAEGDNPGSKNLWYVLYPDGIAAGKCGSWRTGVKYTWCARSLCTLGIIERQQHDARLEQIRHQRETEIHQRQLKAATYAERLYENASMADANHQYLANKGIQPHGAKVYRGRLVLPIVDFNGRISSLQFIATNGEKRLLTGGRKQGCFISIPYTQNTHNTQKAPIRGNYADIADSAHHPLRIIICEGWATGCTLAEHETTDKVLAAIDAGNLKSVALAARYRWPSAELVIAGDDDRLTYGNPGATKAKTAAIASGAKLALPQWSEDTPKHLTDFNDLALWLAGGEV